MNSFLHPRAGNVPTRGFRLLALLAGWLVAATAGKPATVTENFSANPLTHGWQIYGNTNLFRWDSTNQNLAVTWDSSQTNSYFYQPLGTILAREDSFRLSFDLTFQDYAHGTTAGKPYDFPAAIGFLNLSNATRTNFSYGTGINSTYGPANLVQFNFFPAFDVYSPTIDQVIIATNNGSWLYNDANLLDMTPGQLFHVEMNYTNRTLTTVVTNNGAQYGVTQTISVPTNFDFRCAAISISSYSDQHASGSILAHGTVDNFNFTVPPPPVQNLTGAFSNHIWKTQFIGRTNWLYTLERTANFQSWTNAAALLATNAPNFVLQDSNAPTGNAFYRIRAERP
ncbi:MAG TPA: hypothetical protein VGI63_03625 [Verrucomicrobiae bacterium]|jgi:hypothetical protein